MVTTLTTVHNSCGHSYSCVSAQLSRVSLDNIGNIAEEQTQLESEDESFLLLRIRVTLMKLKNKVFLMIANYKVESQELLNSLGVKIVSLLI